MVLTVSDDARGLVERARNGDQAAFAELFASLREPLLAVLRSRQGPGLDAEDLLHDTYVRALHSLERFEWQGEGSFEPWLRSIASHVAADAVRKQGRRNVLHLDFELRGSGPSPSRVLARGERRARLAAAMEELSPDHRTVLELARMDRLAIREIAERMGRSESAVKNLLLRATRSLRRSFGDTDSLHLGGETTGSGDASGGR